MHWSRLLILSYWLFDNTKKDKMKTLLYKFSFETTMTTVMYLRPYIPNCSIYTISGWNEFPCCIHNYSYLLLPELPSHARPGNGVARSLFKDRLFITITTHSLCSWMCICIYIYSDHTHSLKLINDPWPPWPSILCSLHTTIFIECLSPV